MSVCICVCIRLRACLCVCIRLYLCVCVVVFVCYVIGFAFVFVFSFLCVVCCVMSSFSLLSSSNRLVTFSFHVFHQMSLYYATNGENWTSAKGWTNLDDAQEVTRDKTRLD